MTIEDDTLKTQRSIQERQDRSDAKQEGGEQKDDKKEAVQAGAREQPVELPAQHLSKPGSEADLELAPRFLAPDYV
ncbi:MAG: short-chain dehydrogenase, partial [Rubrivivax sp.]